jgi:glycosyltransferase involved in cell wall biosynthesis
VISWFYDRQPGLAIYTARLQALLKRAHVTLICRSARDAERLGLPLNVHVIDTLGESQLDILRYARQAARHVRQHPGDPVLLMSAQVAMCALWLPAQQVSLYWNEMPEHVFPPPRWNLLKAAGHAVMRRLTYGGALAASVVMPISGFMQQDLLTRGRTLQATPVVPMGVFGELPERAHTPPSTSLRVVYAGSLTPEKGRHELIEGVLQALDAGLKVHLTLLGMTTAEQRHLSKLFDARGHGRAIDPLGLQPHHEALRHMAQADVAFAMLHPEPHFQFNPPTKIFEYLACGVPVLFNDIRTLSHYLAHGRTGYCAELSPDGVHQALAWMCEHREVLGAWREDCRQAGEPYRWERIEAEFIQALQTPDLSA